MHLSLDQILIFNGLISVAVHVWVFIRWLGKGARSGERYLYNHHRRNHQAKFRECVEGDCKLKTVQSLQEIRRQRATELAQLQESLSPSTYSASQRLPGTSS